MLISSHNSNRRRGVILIVVLAMLTLFTILGLSFVLVADAQATASRIARESESSSKPDVDAEAAMSFFLGQFLYDVDDDGVGVRSSLRGHSLVRSLYGYNAGGTNDRPFNGTGRLHDRNPMPAATLASFANPIAKDGAYLVNYRYFPADGFLRDPERLGFRADPTQPRGTYTGGFNVPYTYPDHNNFYLGLIDPTTGAIVTPSFHREYLFGAMNLPATPPATGAQPFVNYNPNWTNFEGKYLTVRPRPEDNAKDTNGRPLFPYPTDRWGDVKNLDGAPGGCDSIWIDIGAPVQQAPDGRYYKMLVAPLVLQMDGRINLNVAGNLLGYGQTNNQTHRSNQGWGAWEVNPAYVLDAAEWRKLFLGYDGAVSGTARVRGRYDNGSGGVRKPLTTPLTGTLAMRAWAQADFNGMRDANNNGDQPRAVQMPGTGAGTSTAWFAFPNWPADTYNNGLGKTNGVPNGINEFLDHPQYYDPLNPNTTLNRKLPVSGMAQLLRFGGSGSEMLPSELTRLLTNSVRNARLRNQVTLLSMDFDRPGAVPYVWDPAAAATAYGMSPTLPTTAHPYPTRNAAIPFQPLTARNAVTVFNDGREYDDPTTWRYRARFGRALERLNLSRGLTAYPAVDVTTGQSSNAANTATVDAERSAFAAEIFEELRFVVGANTPANVRALPPAQQVPQYNALRYLAQLAANIVDYIDNDDYSTTFAWDAGATPPAYVHGFETPRLLINETYVQYDNDPGSLEVVGNVTRVPAGGHYTVNTWVELMNPMLNDTNLNPGDCTALLATPGNAPTPIYQIVIAPDTNVNNPLVVANAILDPNNPTGTPPPNANNQTHTDWGAAATRSVTPFAAPNYFDCTPGSNVGFYVVAPVSNNAKKYVKDPQLGTPTINSTSMTYNVPAANAPSVVRPTIILQRLANPSMPLQANPAQALYNPFVTIDFVERIQYPENANTMTSREQFYDARLHDLAGNIVADPRVESRYAAWGRSQPYEGSNDTTDYRLIEQPASTVVGAANNTFFRQNSTAATAAALNTNNTNGTPDASLKQPFDWLVHLDRTLISPAELLHVTGAKPAGVTHAFATRVGATLERHRHRAPWLDETTRLHRFLEFVTTGPRGQGLTPGNRRPGLVNLNDVWTRETFRALADPQQANGFDANAVDTLADAVIGQRSPGSTGTTTPVLGPTDPALVAAVTAAGMPPVLLNRPFWPLSLGFNNAADDLYGGAHGIENTLLRTNAAGTGQTFDVGLAAGNVPAKHPYQQKELLTKIYNNVTVRGNVFAVWVTAGFFETNQAGTLLGAEMNKSENRHVRHRMFSIVDRTQMTTFATGLAADVAPNTYLVAKILNGSSGTDPRTLNAWNASTPGTMLTFSPNTANEETVMVNAAGNVTLTRTHQIQPNGNGRVISRGNPGPWTTQPSAHYDPKKDADVVPYFAIID